MEIKILLAQRGRSDEWYACVQYPDGRRTKRHGVFKNEKQAIAFMKRIYGLGKEAVVVVMRRNKYR